MNLTAGVFAAGTTMALFGGLAVVHSRPGPGETLNVRNGVSSAGRPLPSDPERPGGDWLAGSTGAHAQLRSGGPLDGPAPVFAQPTFGAPTSAPPVATCVPTPGARSGLYSDVVVYPGNLEWIPGDQCQAEPEPGYVVLAIEVDNLGSGPSFDFWVRAEGCTVVPVQERIGNLDPGDRAEVALVPVGESGAPCVVLADAACETDDPNRGNNFWEGVPATPAPLTPAPCENATASPTPTASPSATPATTATAAPGASVLFLPRVMDRHRGQPPVVNR